MAAGTEAAVKDAAAGVSGDAQDGRVDEGHCVCQPPQPPRGSRPSLGHRGRREAPRRCRAGLSAPTGELVDGRTVCRATAGQGAATLVLSCMHLMRVGTYFCTCRIYVCVVQ